MRVHLRVQHLSGGGERERGREGGKLPIPRHNHTGLKPLALRPEARCGGRVASQQQHYYRPLTRRASGNASPGLPTSTTTTHTHTPV